MKEATLDTFAKYFGVKDLMSEPFQPCVTSERDDFVEIVLKDTMVIWVAHSNKSYVEFGREFDDENGRGTLGKIVAVRVWNQ